MMVENYGRNTFLENCSFPHKKKEKHKKERDQTIIPLILDLSFSLNSFESRVQRHISFCVYSIFQMQNNRNVNDVNYSVASQIALATLWNFYIFSLSCLLICCQMKNQRLQNEKQNQRLQLQENPSQQNQHRNDNFLELNYMLKSTAPPLFGRNESLFFFW